MSFFSRCLVFIGVLFAAVDVEAQAPVVSSSPAPAKEAAGGLKLPSLRLTGFIKPTVLVGNGVESYGTSTFNAITAAANPVFLSNPDQVAVGFQTQQTRLGLVIGEGGPIIGQVEVDFVDYTKSSPAQSTTIRVRQAFAEWTINENHKLSLGHRWDVFSPLNSHTYDIVGGMFQAGNAGFMRQQLIYTGTAGSFEGVLALGLTQQNNTNAFTNVEYNRMPTIAARASYRPGKATWVGVAVIGTRLAFDAAKPTEKARLSLGANVFADLTRGALNLRAEAYGGQNLNNLGLLVLGQGTRTQDVQEVGGYASAKVTLAKEHAVHVVVGGAFVLNTEDLPLGYTPATAATEDKPAAAAVRAGPAIIPGIERNVGVRVGYAYSPVKGLSISTEPFVFLTRHKLDPSVSFDEDRFGWGVQVGGLYTF